MCLTSQTDVCEGSRFSFFPFNGISYNLVPRSGAAGVANEGVVRFNTVLTVLAPWAGKL